MVVLVRVDRDLAEEGTVLVEHPDVVVDDVEPNVSMAVVVADAHVQEPAPVAKGDLAVVVDDVLSDPVVRLIDQRVRLGFVAAFIGVAWCAGLP